MRKKLPKGEAMFNQLLAHYKWHAKRRGLKWDLSKEVFKSLTKQLCFYCGTAPKTIFGAFIKSKGLEHRYNGTYTYNGVDRINPKEGYIRDNCVSCCTKCNRTKWDLSQVEFLEHIKTLYNYLELWK